MTDDQWASAGCAGLLRSRKQGRPPVEKRGGRKVNWRREPCVRGLVSPPAPALFSSMPTLTKSRKPAAKRRLPVGQKVTDARFPGLVRDSVSGLLVRPLAPGQKKVSLAVIEKALADSL